jgi:DNA-directed RNA polymerase specialized sigma24 family protein
VINKQAAIKRKQNKTRLMDAYDAWKRKEPGSADTLMLAVRHFAYTKVYHLEHDFKKFGSAETADDWTQDVCAKVWKKLDRFVGTGSKFYSYVHKAAFNRGIDAFEKLYEDRQTKTCLTVPIDDGTHIEAISGFFVRKAASASIRIAWILIVFSFRLRLGFSTQPAPPFH